MGGLNCRGCIELFFVKGIEVFLIKRCLVPIDDREGQKQNIFVKLVEHSLYRRLFLKKPILQKEPGSVKTRDHAGKFLNHCLMNRLFHVSKDEGIPMWYLLRRRHHVLKPLERFV